MNRLTRDVFVERTQSLLLRQGGLDVSLSSVLEACNANKGSLYHFFPNGKEELLVAAMERQAEHALASNRAFIAKSKTTGEAVFRLAKSLGEMIDRRDCPDFLPFSAAGAICDEASEELRSVCIKTLDTLEKLYAESLRRDGVPTRVAKSLASTIVSTIEGALLQSRARNNSASVRFAATHLRTMIETCVDRYA
ncbi:MAG: TetR/AcrR family transcriptional regulator [Planctomycetota bacterium]